MNGKIPAQHAEGHGLIHCPSNEKDQEAAAMKECFDLEELLPVKIDSTELNRPMV